MLFALLDVSSIPHSLIENVTHPPAAIDISGRSLVFAYVYHNSLDKIKLVWYEKLSRINSGTAQSKPAGAD
ncbi:MULTISPECIES: hypothetical protein [unclassified Microcoleus]|uniref:hypothetical protein n=1 Tax=unclassified Microcoleus TaxID=2642155 RepID=UPI002FD28E75